MTREFGEGERNERREDETDDLQELRDRIRARKEGLGRESDEESAESRGEAGQERNELDEFASYVEHLKMRYGPDGGGEAERALAPERDRALGKLEVGAYQREENDDPLEQHSATSEAKREGVSGPPERANDPKEAADPARVGASPRSGEAKVSQAEERVKEVEPPEGRAETPRPNEGATLKNDEAESRLERGVAAVSAEPRQAYLEKSEAPASRLDEPQVGVERKETRSVEPAEGLGVFSATALRRTDDSTAFEVRLDSLREAGVTFETDKTYEIKGRIGEVCDFRKMYSPGESYRMAILAPKEYAQSITPGEKYDVRIGSVREISRNEEHLGVFSATAYRIPGSEDRFRFDLLVSSFEKRTGVRFEEGKMYEVTGRIGDVCDFKLTRTAERSQHLFVFAPREYATDLTPGQKYDLTIDSVREKTECHVTDARGFPRLTLQKRALEAAGLRLDGVDREGKIVAELNLKNSKGVTHRLFANVEPKESLVVMSMDRIGAKVGDVFDLQRARKYSEGGFVEDFKKYRSRELSNVRLQLEGMKLSMFVNDTRFEISEYHLDAYKLQALLRCNMEPFQREIRFWFDGKEVTAKLGGALPIAGFAKHASGLEITYKMGNRTSVTTSDAQLALRAVEMDKSEIGRRIELLSKPDTDEGTYALKADTTLLGYVLKDLTRLGRGRYMKEKGDASEEISPVVLEKAQWTEVVRHPFHEGDQARGSNRRGPDSLIRNKDTNELCLFEFKWWVDTQGAYEAACEQVRDYFRDYRLYKGEKISRAYIGILEWDLKSTTGSLRVKRVC